MPVGDIQTLAKVLELGRRWYGDYLRADWRKRSMQEARALFRDLGFSHPVWDLDFTTGRF